jgi:hypothetical protein
MESIFNQYKSVNKGILSESQFLRNVKMALPKFISNVTTFKDAVIILKSKGIITEAKEAKPTDYSMPNDWCDPNEYDLGMRYELGKGTDEEKASKIVYKNIMDNKYYYSQLHLAGYDESAMKVDRKKRTDLEIPVAKDNFVDTINGTKKVKVDKLTEDELKLMIGKVLNEIDFTSSQLPGDPKKETASIGNLQFGVNILKFDNLPDPNSDRSTVVRDENDLNDWKTNKDPELEVIIDRTGSYPKITIPAYEEGRKKASDVKLSFYQSDNSRFKNN